MYFAPDTIRSFTWAPTINGTRSQPSVENKRFRLVLLKTNLIHQQNQHDVPLFTCLLESGKLTATRRETNERFLQEPARTPEISLLCGNPTTPFRWRQRLLS